MLIYSIQKPDLPPLEMSSRFRTEIAYFMTPSGESGAPVLGPDEYWIRLADVIRWLDDGVVSVISPLDAESQAEIELSEEQERWLEWLVEHEIEHLRVENP